MGKKRTKRKLQEGSHPTPPRVLPWVVSVDLTVLEVTWGYDGPFRGPPEPVIVFAAFHVPKADSPRVAPLGRAIARFEAEPPFPTSIKPAAPATIRAKIRATDHDRLVVLAVAIEEDAGYDVARVHALIEESVSLRFWESDAAEPSPQTLADALTLSPSSPPFATRIHVMDDVKDLRDTCQADDYVGARLIVLEAGRRDETFRAQFVSGDGKNDWTAMLQVAMR